MATSDETYIYFLSARVNIHTLVHAHTKIPHTGSHIRCSQEGYREKRKQEIWLSQNSVLPRSSVRSSGLRPTSSLSDANMRKVRKRRLLAHRRKAREAEDAGSRRWVFDAEHTVETDRPRSRNQALRIRTYSEPTTLRADYPTNSSRCLPPPLRRSRRRAPCPILRVPPRPRRSRASK